MKEISTDKKLVSCCWLYCGACNKFLNNKCSGCKKLDKSPFWCSIRDCCMGKGYENCAECEVYPDTRKCNKYNGTLIRTLGYFCGSDRSAATKMIKKIGTEGFAKYMSENKLQRIKR